MLDAALGREPGTSARVRARHLRLAVDPGAPCRAPSGPPFLSRHRSVHFTSLHFPDYTPRARFGHYTITAPLF